MLEDSIEAAEQLEDQGRWREAMNVYVGLAEQEDRVPLFLRAAYAAAEGELWEEAVGLLERVIRLDDRCVDAYVKLGLIFETLDRNADARVALERALTIEERQPILTVLGEVQRRLGDDAAAIATLRRSLVLNADDDEAHHGLGVLLRGSDPLAAAEHFRRALSLDPDHPYSHRELGAALWKAGRLEEAQDACRRAIERDESDAWAHSYLGNVLYLRGDHGAAKLSLRRATELEPGNGYFWGILGRVTAELGLTQEADRYFRKGLSLGLDDPYLYTRYGIFLRDSGRLTQARRYLRKAIELDPNQKHARTALNEMDQPATPSS